jgi:apolipoprotein N-acyltransferase
MLITAERVQSPAGRDGEGGQRRTVPPGRSFSFLPRLAAPLVAASVAVFLAAPWLDERLVWGAWIGVAIGLMVVPSLRGWRGEAWALAAAFSALAIAFHWTPRTLATAMASTYFSGLFVAIPVVAWDALRLAAPVLLAARVTQSPGIAWLPAALFACAIEAAWPSVFPWKLGYAQAGWPLLVQAVDLFGPETATFVLFAHAGAIVWALEAIGIVRRAGPRWIGAAAAIVCLLNAAYGVVSLATWEARVSRAPSFTATLVQTNPGDPDGIAALRSLTAARTGAEPPDLVCWPECSAGEFDCRLDSFADPERVAGLSRQEADGGLLEGPLGAQLLCGGIVYEGYAERPAALHQSALLVDAAGGLRGRYHKRHLMPFGEYVPLAAIWPDLRRRFPLVDDFSRGTDATVLAGDDGLRIGTLLCYEDMVPGAARSLVLRGANVLVSLVNGNAFTATLTLRQHRQLAQLRAVECRRSLLRCAATGETCVISPAGRIVAALPLHSRGTLDARVPLIDTVTFASRLGPLFPAVCGVVGIAMLIGRRVWPRSPVGVVPEKGYFDARSRDR